MKANWIAIALEFASFLSAMQLNGTLQVTHETNLIWAQDAELEISSAARIVGINGDPQQWIPIRVASSRYITAPSNTWKFESLSFDFKRQMLFWSESSNNKIQGVSLNGSTIPFDIYAGTSGIVHGLAFDWLRGNVYWTDARYNWIVMAGVTSQGSVSDTSVLQGESGRYHKTIVDNWLDEPAGIVVHAIKRKLFWTDIGMIPKIESSDLIGENRKILATKNMNQPIGITLDIKTDKLYWVDRRLKTIEVMSLDGSDRRLLVKSTDMVSFRSIAVFQDYIFITEQKKKQLIVYSKENGVIDVMFSLGEANPHDVIMYDDTQQPMSTSSCVRGSCDQLCTEDLEGLAVCMCSQGYKLRPDGATCKKSDGLDPPQIIYSIGPALCSFPGNIPNINLDTISLDNYCFLTPDKYITEITPDLHNLSLFLFDNETESVYELRMDKKPAYGPRILIKDVGNMVGLSYDWSARNIYWIDASQNKKIVVSSRDGGFRKDVIDSGLVNPRSLAVNAVNRKLYWSDDIGTDTAHIAVSDLDGENTKILVSTNLVQPRHITIDYVSYRLYWCDVKLGRIEWSSFDGTMREAIIQQPESVISGVAIFQDFLFWTESASNNGLHLGLKDTGDKIRGIIHPQVGQARGVVTFDKSSQPLAVNPCKSTATSTGCQQLCFPKSDTKYTCGCSTGYELHANGYHCVIDFSQDFIMFSDTQLQNIFTMSVGKVQIKLQSLFNKSSIENPQALSLDPENRRIYWADTDSKMIKSANVDGTGMDIIGILSRNSILAGIAVDPVTTHLYYTDAGNKIIGVFDTRSKRHLTLITKRLDKPQAIVLHEELGLMFWTDLGRQSRIERASMDGSERKLVMNTGKGGMPTGITIDQTVQKLYWCNAKTQTLEYSDLNGQNHGVILQLAKSQLTGVSVLDNNLYYTDWNRRSVMKINLESTTPRKVAIGPQDFNHLSGIAAYRHVNVNQKLRHSCRLSRQRCSHFCLPTPRHRICRCPDGIMLSDDLHNCVLPPETSFYGKWLTNAAPQMVPTPVSLHGEMWKRITTNPSMISDTNYDDTQSTKLTIAKNINNGVKEFDNNNEIIKKVESSEVKFGDVSFNNKPQLADTLIGISNNETTVPKLPTGIKMETTTVYSMVSSKGSSNTNTHREDTDKSVSVPTLPETDEIIPYRNDTTSVMDLNNDQFNFLDYDQAFDTVENTANDNATNISKSTSSSSISQWQLNVSDSNINQHQGEQNTSISQESLSKESEAYLKVGIANSSSINIATDLVDNNTKLEVFSDNEVEPSKYSIPEPIDYISISTSATFNILSNKNIENVYITSNITKNGVSTTSLPHGSNPESIDSHNSVNSENTTVYNSSSLADLDAGVVSNETHVLSVSDRVHSPVIGFLVVICSAVLVLCVTVVCTVFVYNKLIKKPKVTSVAYRNNTATTTAASNVTTCSSSSSSHLSHQNQRTLQPHQHSPPIKDIHSVTLDSHELGITIPQHNQPPLPPVPPHGAENVALNNGFLPSTTAKKVVIGYSQTAAENIANEFDCFINGYNQQGTYLGINGLPPHMQNIKNTQILHKKNNQNIYVTQHKNKNKIKSSKAKKDKSKRQKVLNSVGDIYYCNTNGGIIGYSSSTTCDAAKKYTTMKDCDFTGHVIEYNNGRNIPPCLTPDNGEENNSYDVEDYCSDFSFDTDSNGTSPGDLVTFRNTQDSIA